ncbi:MAG: hypothetical protein ABIZ81_01945 [Opitutaceae bacterium]
MPSRFTRSIPGALLLMIGVSSLSAAQTSGGSAKDLPRDPRTSAQRAAKGPLPDPVLLDGSKFEAEKRPEYGMLGEFEMPGDENAKSDRVGQNSEQPGQGGGGPQDPNAKEGGGGGSEGTRGQQAAKAGGGAEAIEQNAAQGAAEGTQVSEMKGEAQSGQSGQSGSKPQQVALGDKAMQIKPQANVPSVVGAQQQPVGKEVPQQYDKNTPSGGKQTPGRNQGVEKGRVMPAGI